MKKLVLSLIFSTICFSGVNLFAMQNGGGKQKEKTALEKVQDTQKQWKQNHPGLARKMGRAVWTNRSKKARVAEIAIVSLLAAGFTIEEIYSKGLISEFIAHYAVVAGKGIAHGTVVAGKGIAHGTVALGSWLADHCPVWGAHREAAREAAREVARKAAKLAAEKAAKKAAEEAAKLAAEAARSKGFLGWFRG